MPGNIVTVQRHISSKLTFANQWDHFLARWAINRSGHRVEPGIYALGNPGPNAPVFVTANYTLSFDALRSALQGVDAYLLILDTQGINVWCAAGKGTFGTEELIRQVEQSGLQEIVNHRRLVLPQLGAPGISAHEVKKRTGFHVEYGPVRADDLPEYLRTKKASPEMRRVRFPLRDRLTLIPVELVTALFPWLLAAILLRSTQLLVALLAGILLFPILLPWLPTKNFSTKGWILGGLVAIPFAIQQILHQQPVLWIQVGWALAALLIMPAITAFMSLNFTGATTFTSRTGVRREINRYIPPMVWSFAIGMLLQIALLIIRTRG